MSKDIKDKYGNKIVVGTKVIYARYGRYSNLYFGDVIKIDDKNITIKGTSTWTSKRIVPFDKVQQHLLVNPYEKED